MVGVLQENYGQKNAASEAKVKAIFADIDLTKLFNEYESASYAKINGLIEAIPEGGKDGLKREIFQSFLAKVYKRAK